MKECWDHHFHFHKSYDDIDTTSVFFKVALKFFWYVIAIGKHFPGNNSHKQEFVICVKLLSSDVFIDSSVDDVE